MGTRRVRDPDMRQKSRCNDVWSGVRADTGKRLRERNWKAKQNTVTATGICWGEIVVLCMPAYTGRGLLMTR